MKKAWEDRVQKLLKKSLGKVPQELNELDWKQNISPNNKKLSFHLSAFANHPGGGVLAYGINDSSGELIGIKKTVPIILLISWAALQETL